VLRAARRLWPRVRVVLMSGSLPPSRAEESAAEGIVVLAKPFGPAALIEVLGSLVAGAR
jgi:CheY-like chemotaxis protein